jgi:methylenetetrahydrofolate reductase (NADPH)
MNVDVADIAGALGALSTLLAGFSLEISSRDSEDIDACRHLLSGDTRVYVPVVPGDRPDRMVTAARALSRAGLIPVPHLAARYFRSVAVLDDHVGRLCGEAGVEEVMVIGGDTECPAGPLACAEDILAGGVLERRGIRQVGLAGYPEGHPRIPAPVLAEALRRKIDLAAAQGLDVHVVTQFCFHVDSVLRWLRAFAADGCMVRVRIGVAGPARVSTLIRYALHCGVGVSARAIMSHGGRFARLAQERGPDALLRSLAGAVLRGDAPGVDGVHFFTFGGAAETARWVSSAAARRTTVATAGDGFEVK